MDDASLIAARAIESPFGAGGIGGVTERKEGDNADGEESNFEEIGGGIGEFGARRKEMFQGF